MRSINTLVFFFSLLACIGGVSVNAQSNSKGDVKILKVGLVNNYLPCSGSGKSGVSTGFAIDIWREVQEKLIDVSYEPVLIDTFNEAINYASTGKADLIVSCHAITEERLDKVQFSVPYARDSVGMISAVNNRSFFGRVIRMLGQEHVIRSLLLLVSITGIVAVSITLLERSNYQTNNRDKILRTLKTWALLFIGQALESLAEKRLSYVPLILLAGCAQILLVTVLVAELTTSNIHQVTKIVALEDMDKNSLRKIIFEGLAVVDGTEQQRRLGNKLKTDGLHSKGIISKISHPASLPEMINGLKAGKYKHILDTRSVLLYALSKDLDPTKFEISMLSEFSTPEAFVFGKNLSLVDKKIINQGIAEMNYNGRIAEILSRYQ